MRGNLAVIVVSVAAMLTACAARMTPVSGTDASSVSITVAVGDTVRVLTKHGDRPTFRVVDISNDMLIGEAHQVRFEDMAFVEKRVAGRAADGQPGPLAVVLMVALGTVAVLELQRLGPGIQSGY